MSISSQLKSHYDQLLQQSNGGAAKVSLSAGAVSLAVHLAGIQALACELDAIEVGSPRYAQANADELSQLGQQMADRLRYLLEPLQIHEIDRQADAVQLRSFPPRREEKKVRYFEATLTRDGGVALVRYEKTPGQLRQRVSAVVTLEVLQLLCEDLVRLST